jgi:hypothetical protein
MRSVDTKTYTLAPADSDPDDDSPIMGLFLDVITQEALTLPEQRL